MHRRYSFVKLCFFLTCALISLPVRAAVIWDPSVNGALSTTGSTPTPFTLAPGDNSIISTVGGASNQNWVALTISPGFELSHVVLDAYQSTDVQGFTGVQAGSSFIGSTTSAASYLGYTHFGTAAANGALPAANLVNADLLPLMGNTALAPGSQGFTPPLAAGSYVFLIQQLGATTNYAFDFQVTPIPEPATLPLAALAAAGLLGLRRRRPRVP